MRFIRRAGWRAGRGAGGNGFARAETDMDDATIAAMAKRGTFYVPTIAHNRLLPGQLAEDWLRGRFQGEGEEFMRGLGDGAKGKRRGEFRHGSDAIYTISEKIRGSCGWFVKRE